MKIRVCCYFFFTLCLFLQLSITAQERAPKVYDCFLFHNEFEILEIRLNELHDYVDYFVIVESAETFRGKPKPFYLKENIENFAKFKDKIIHVMVEERLETDDPWERQYFHRNQIMRGLKNCSADDIIIFSDADEIVRCKLIDYFRKALNEKADDVLFCEHSLYYYFLNRFDFLEWGHYWPGAAVLHYATLVEKGGTQNIRSGRLQYPHVVHNAGWHFSYMGGHERVVKKLGSLSEATVDTPENRAFEMYEKKVKALQLVPIDESYPRYIYENQDLWKERGFIDNGNG